MFGSKSSPSTRKCGADYENLALHYLKSQGLRCIERNFNCKLGEIDLIMRHEELLVFIEVRYRASKQFGGPLHSVTPSKQLKLLKTAALYLQSHQSYQHLPCRFDVLAILGQGENEPLINWVQNAFS